MRDEPCFHCVLADCNERSPRCALRKAANRAENKRRNGRADEITAEDRAAQNAFFRIWKLEDLAKRSEARS